MPDFLVNWTIGIIEAEDPIDAAKKTLAIQRDPESIATVFEVTDCATRTKTVVDLDEVEGTDDSESED